MCTSCLQVPHYLNQSYTVCLAFYRRYAPLTCSLYLCVERSTSAFGAGYVKLQPSVHYICLNVLFCIYTPTFKLILYTSPLLPYKFIYLSYNLLHLGHQSLSRALLCSCTAASVCVCTISWILYDSPHTQNCSLSVIGWQWCGILSEVFSFEFNH